MESLPPADEPTPTADPPRRTPRRWRTPALLAGLSAMLLSAGAGLAATGWYVWLPAAQNAAAARPRPVVVSTEPDKPPPPNLPANVSFPQRVDKLWPLPQDRAASAKLRAAREAWVLSGTLAAFEKTAGANAPWADKAREAYRAGARRSARDRFPYAGVEHQALLDAVVAAVAAGADDPMIRYWEFRFVHPHQAAAEWKKAVDPVRELAALRRAATEMPASGYHPAWKMHAAWNVFLGLRESRDRHGQPVPPGEIAAAEARFWEAFRVAAADPNPHARGEVVSVSHHVIEDAHDRRQDRAAGWRAVDDALAAANAPAWTRLVIEGDFLVSYGWEARGIGLAHTVTRDGWRLLEERLAAARECLEAAWAADPTRPDPAARMIGVLTGQGADRGEMEKWFRRAMTADPDSYAACHAKREWLKPKWYGEAGEDWEFQGQCFRTKNWYAGLPLLLEPTYSERLTPTDDEVRKYFSHPTAWQNARGVYEGYLEAYPADRAMRTRYARVAARAGKWAVAAAQFDALGDQPWPGVFADKAEFDRLRGDARKHAADAPDGQ